MDRKMMIKAVREAMDDIEVHGKDNLDRLLGCMQVLDTLISGWDEEVETDVCGE